jgi:hypothetical protein
MDGLLALCILGIKQSDGSLIKAALGEMEKRLDEKGGAAYRPDFVSIKALTLVLQGKKNEARSALLNEIKIRIYKQIDLKLRAEVLDHYVCLVI